MAPGVKDGKKETTRGRTPLILVIPLCLLSISSFVVPVSGFALKNCRISKDKAICSGSQLRAVPQDVPSTVKAYDLAANKISRINATDFRNFPVLSELDLSNNNITKIENRAFVNLISLKKLNLNHNKIAELGEDLFKGLSNLTELRITRNHIGIVAPMAFKPMIRLEFLDISDNKLHNVSKIHPIVQHLPNLRELYIQKNYLSAFKSWEVTNSSIPLKYLDLSHNPMTVFQITADVLPNLTWFCIGSASTTREMKWDVRSKTFLSRVSTLDISILQMSFNDMKTLLKSVNSSLTRLRMNRIQKNFTALVNIACTIPTMSMLQFREYKLNFVWSDLFKSCINVTELDLAKNQIINISDDAFRSSQSLKILTLSNNRLTSVPAATRNLPILQKLDLSHNWINKLGCEDFANQTMLRQLNLYENSITELQKCLFKDLIRLEVLKLQSNQITKLHSVFKTYPLPNLRQLLLNDNQLKSFVDGEFKGLHSLQNLSLHHNIIDEPHKTCFTGLTNLTTLLLQSNKITAEVLNGIFNPLINLKRLEMRENSIQYRSDLAIPDPPFSQLSNLETLTIPSQHRRLKSIFPRNFLQGLTNLKSFDIGNAQLISLHDDTFIYTPNLQNLDISSNEIRYLTPNLFSPISNLKSLYISTTILRSLDFLSKANLTNLEFMQARKNQYSVIREEAINALPALVYLDLMGNSFRCDCDNAWFVNWTEKNTKTQVFDAYNFTCNYPENLQGTKLFNLDVRSCSVDIGFIYFITTSCATLLFMVVAFTYHFLRWHLAYAYYLFLGLLFDTRHKNKHAPNQYDAFISYNTHDEPWVIQELLPKLEEAQGWRLCLHHRDFEPGKPIIDNITDSIYGSRKTICVISRKYLESEWCSKEIQVASFRLFDEQKDVLILVFLEDIPTRELSPYYRMRKLLKKRTYLSWPRAEEHTELFWEKLRKALKTGEDDGDGLLQLTVADR